MGTLIFDGLGAAGTNDSMVGIHVCLSLPLIHLLELQLIQKPSESSEAFQIVGLDEVFIGQAQVIAEVDGFPAEAFLFHSKV